MLVIAARCSRKWSEDFMTSSNEFYAFHMSAHLQSSFFSENSLWSNILNLLQTKVTPWIPIFSFFQYDPKEVRVLRNLIFFIFELADDQKSFNAACSNYGFLHYFERLKFFSSNNTPARASPCNRSSWLGMHFK